MILIRGMQHKSAGLTFDATIHNRFDVELVDSISGKIRKTAVAFNVICDQMWDRFAAKSPWFNYIQYGSGNGTPSASDKSLFTHSGYKAASSNKVPTINRKECVAHITRSIQLSETEAVGVTLTEVGIAYSTGTQTLVTHAMLKDMNGNPVSIEKTDTDILNIYATVYAHWPLEYNSPTSPIRFIPDYYKNSNSYYGMALWMLGVSTPPVAAALNTNMVAKSASQVPMNYPTLSTPAFDASTKKLSMAFGRVPVDKGNIPHGAHGVMVFCKTTDGAGTTPIGPCLYFASDQLGGSNIVGESVGTGDGVTKDFATKFDLPTNAEVYVDGVLSTATVDCVPLNYTTMQTYFDMVVVEDGVAYPHWNTLEGYGSIYDAEAGFIRIPYGTYYNPYYEYGVKRLVNHYGNYVPLSVSNDLLTWTDLGKFNSSGIDIPEEHWYSKYWRFGNDGCQVKEAHAVNLTGKNIHFSEPPAEGSVIMVNYHTPTIAKDANHVYDFNVTIQLNEYTEAQ